MGGSEGGMKMVSMLDKKSGQRQLWTDLVKQMSDIMGKESFNLPEMAPGASPLQQLTFDQAQQYLQGGMPMQGIRNDAISRMIRGEPAFAVDPAQREQYFQEAFVDPAMKQYRREILPQTFERYSGGSMSSPDMMRALAMASSDFGTGLTQARANLLDRDIAREQQAREAAAGRVGTGLVLGQEDALAPLRFGQELGGQQRGIAAQLGAERGMRQIYQENPLLNPNLQWLSTALTPTKAPVMEAARPGWGQIIGSLVGLGSVGGAIDSAF